MMKIYTLLIVILLSAAAFAQNLPRIAVYVTGDVPDNEKKALGTRMLSTLVNSGRYKGIERSKSFLAEIEKEQVKQLSGEIDDSQISQLGRQFGVKFVCIADLTPAFGSYQVSARIVNVETAEVEFIGDASSQLKTMDDLALVSNQVVKNMFSGKTMPAREPPPPASPARPAQEKLAQPVRQETTTAKTAFERGNAANENKNYELAIKEYTEAIRIAPDYYRYDKRGDVYMKTGNYANAIADYYAIMQLKGVSSGTKQMTKEKIAAAQIRIGGAYMMKADYDKAIAAYEECLRLKPNNYIAKEANEKLTEARKKSRTGTDVQIPKPAPKTYTLTIANQPVDGGAVAANPQKTAYIANEQVALRAEPRSGYVFAGWSGASLSVKNIISVTMTDNLTLTANFKPMSEPKPQPKPKPPWAGDGFQTPER